MEIEKFNPTLAELNKLVEKTKNIIASDLKDKEQIALVKESRIELKNARVSITKKGKELREEAVAFQKAVIVKEKELIAIIEPEELRLENIEQEAKILKQKEERLAVLPSRKERLAEIKDEVAITDDEILLMDSPTFEEYRNTRITNYNNKIAFEIQERERKVKEAEVAIHRQKELEEAKEKARVEERERMERYEKEKKEREVIEAERKVKEEKEKIEKEEIQLAKEKMYQKFLKENGYEEKNKNNFHLIKEGKSIKLYKFLGEYITE